jgi:hypothetical protein
MLDSWWLKVKRAQKHMVEIRREVGAYAATKPYEFVRVPRPYRKPYSNLNIIHEVRITSQPNPTLAVMLGDFVHNLRSALDHVVVASVPKTHRNTASFPIAHADPFAKRANGEFGVKDNDAREKFETAIRGLTPEAQAVVIRNQPYRLGVDAYRSSIGIISRLENADKHRSLLLVGGGVHNVTADVSYKNGVMLPLPTAWFDQQSGEFGKDGSEVGYRLLDTLPPDFNAAEVEMKFSGTPFILINIPRRGGNQPPSDFPLPLTMFRAIQDVRRVVRQLVLAGHR